MTSNPVPGRRGFIAGSTSLLLLTGCAVLGGPQALTLSPRDLEEWLSRRFPLERRVLEVLDLTVSKPSVQLLPERNRLATAFEVATRDRLFGSTWRGQLALDAALRWVPADSTLRLQEVRVSQFRVEGAESLGRREQAERIGALLAERVLEDLVVYRPSAEHLERLQRHGVAPGAVQVTPRGVELTLTPIAR